MFDTSLAMLVSWLAQGVGFMVGQAWQHPICATCGCLLLGLYIQADEQLHEELLQQLSIRWKSLRQLTDSILRRNCGADFDYSLAKGPHTWIQKAENQSPVNIDEQAVHRLAIHELLNWNHYDELPTSMTLQNTGNTLVLRAQFRSNVPTLSGADLLSSYTFLELCFRWGWANSEGSEHTFNYRKYALEMQVLHRTGACVPRRYMSSYDLLMVGYIFELSAHNPLLDPLIQNLKLVQLPGKPVNISPFPLSYLVYPFRTGFYSYGGSLTQPPCYQGTEWFIFPEALAISDYQLRYFRTLLSGDRVTPITRNWRPVQPLGNRVINLNFYSPYDASHGQRFKLELLHLQQQQREQEQEQDQEQEHELQIEEEEVPTPQPHTKSQPQPLPRQQKMSPTPTTDDEGQLIESLDTTTTITTNTNSKTSVFSTKVNTQQPQPRSQPNYCPKSIVFFSNNNGYLQPQSNVNQLLADEGHYQEQQQQQQLLMRNSETSSCGLCGDLGGCAQLVE